METIIILLTALLPNDGERLFIDDKLLKIPPLQELISSTKSRFKNRTLTPEECAKYYLD